MKHLKLSAGLSGVSCQCHGSHLAVLEAVGTPERSSVWQGLRLGHAFLLGVALLGTSCHLISSREISDPAPSVARLRAGGTVRAEVNQLVQPLVASGEVYGMVVGVVSPGGATQIYRYGRTGQPENNQPPAGDTLFQIGSVSKLFVDALLVRLVEEGQLHYEDTVRSILPATVPLSPDAGKLTLYELVTNTGGLPRQPNNLAQLWCFMSFLFTGHNLYGCITKEYLYEYLRTCRLPPKAKREYGYSNIGIGLLTHLIEVKTGRSISALLDEQICRPLGLRDTVLRLNPDQKNRLAIGHAGDQPEFMGRNSAMSPWDMGDVLSGSCGMYSTVDDLLIFARANLEQLHHPLEPDLVSLQRVRVKTPKEDIGMGWTVNYFKAGRMVLTYKQGMVSGYTAYIGLNPERQVAVVVLCNNFNWLDKVGHNLLLRLYDAAEPVNSLPTTPLDHSSPSNS